MYFWNCQVRKYILTRRRRSNLVLIMPENQPSFTTATRVADAATQAQQAGRKAVDSARSMPGRLADAVDTAGDYLGALKTQLPFVLPHYLGVLGFKEGHEHASRVLMERLEKKFSTKDRSKIPQTEKDKAEKIAKAQGAIESVMCHLAPNWYLQAVSEREYAEDKAKYGSDVDRPDFGATTWLGKNTKKAVDLAVNIMPLAAYLTGHIGPLEAIGTRYLLTGTTTLTTDILEIIRMRTNERYKEQTSK